MYRSARGHGLAGVSLSHRRAAACSVVLVNYYPTMQLVFESQTSQTADASLRARAQFEWQLLYALLLKKVLRRFLVLSDSFLQSLCIRATGSLCVFNGS